MWVKLLCIKTIERHGKSVMYHPGDWVNVGRQTAIQWMSEGCAWANTDKMTVPQAPKTHASGFTMFTIPMAWEGLRGLRQENALTSWRMLTPQPSIILLYDDPGTAAAAKRLGCIYVPGARRNQWDTPLISETFREGQAKTPTDVVCYCNTDIILAGLGQAIMAIAGELEQFLMVGRRWDLDIKRKMKFGDNWRNELAAEVKNKGRLHNVSAVDFFGFRKGMYENVPDFAVGRSCWDNWLVSEAVRQGIAVVDVTPVVLSVHQDIPPPGKKRPPKPHIESDAERLVNRKFYDAREGRVSGTVKHADWILDEGGLRRK